MLSFPVPLPERPLVVAANVAGCPADVLQEASEINQKCVAVHGHKHNREQALSNSNNSAENTVSRQKTTTGIIRYVIKEMIERKRSGKSR